MGIIYFLVFCFDGDWIISALKLLVPLAFMRTLIPLDKLLIGEFQLLSEHGRLLNEVNEKEKTFYSLFCPTSRA